MLYSYRDCGCQAAHLCIWFSCLLWGLFAEYGNVVDVKINRKGVTRDLPVRCVCWQLFLLCVYWLGRLEWGRPNVLLQLLFFFISTREICCDILLHSRKYIQFYDPGPEIFGAKNMLNLARFWMTLILIIPGTDRDIQNQKTNLLTTILLALDWKKSSEL